MNPTPDSFEQVRKLLALKKYEQPPPGYFARLPDRIMERICAEELGRISWWHRILGRLEGKPVVACAYSLTLSGLLLLGFSASQAVQPTQALGFPPSSALAVAGLRASAPALNAFAQERISWPGQSLSRSAADDARIILTSGGW